MILAELKAVELRGVYPKALTTSPEVIVKDADSVLNPNLERRRVLFELLGEEKLMS